MRLLPNTTIWKAGDAEVGAGYSRKVLDHFKNPRNVGKLKDYNGRSLTGDEECGDFLEVTIRVDDDTLIIKEVSFRCRGCPAAIATSSMMTEMAKGKEINEVLGMSEEDLVRALDGLPEHKLHCSVLGIRAIRDAVADYMLYSMMQQQGLVKDRREYEKAMKGKRVAFEVHVCDGSCEKHLS